MGSIECLDGAVESPESCDEDFKAIGLETRDRTGSKHGVTPWLLHDANVTVHPSTIATK